jgi:DNA-binding transcriptional ArsR family regulator
MNEVFHALAHDARRAMLSRLASSELTVGQLAEPFSMSLESASKHIRVLERAGLVRRRVEGRRHICRLSPAKSWMTASCTAGTGWCAMRSARVNAGCPATTTGGLNPCSMRSMEDGDAAATAAHAVASSQGNINGSPAYAS